MNTDREKFLDGMAYQDIAHTMHLTCVLCIRVFQKLVGNFNQNSNLWETKQIEKTYVKEKQSHAQDKIYVVRQFAYVHGVTGISL